MEPIKLSPLFEAGLEQICKKQGVNTPETLAACKEETLLKFKEKDLPLIDMKNLKKAAIADVEAGIIDRK